LASELDELKLKKDQLEKNYQSVMGKLSLSQEQARSSKLAVEYEQQVRM